MFAELYFAVVLFIDGLKLINELETWNIKCEHFLAVPQNATTRHHVIHVGCLSRVAILLRRGRF